MTTGGLSSNELKFQRCERHIHTYCAARCVLHVIHQLALPISLVSAAVGTCTAAPQPSAAVAAFAAATEMTTRCKAADSGERRQWRSGR